MKLLFSVGGLLALAAPLALAQTPGPLPDQEAGHPGGPPGMVARHDGRDRDTGSPGGPGGPGERGPREGMHREEPGDFGRMQTPPGTWWRNPDVVSRIGLAPDQVKRIESIFLESRVQLIHMHASLEEEQVRLEPLLATNPINQQVALAEISKIADTRADLEKANAKMLLSIRGVLTNDQWTKLQHPAGPHRAGETGGPGGMRGMRGPGGAPGQTPPPAP